MNSPLYLFLDDERNPSNVKWIDMPLYPWTVVRNVKDFSHIISTYYSNYGKAPLYISFDYDLHYLDAANASRKDYIHQFPSGKTAAIWLKNFCLEKNMPIPEFQVHSLNPRAEEVINSILKC